MNNGRPRKAKLDALIERQESIRAALEEIRLRRRAQERDDRDRLASLIGEAMLLADADETDAIRRSERRALIAEALGKYTKGPSRAFVIAKKWIIIRE
jgi:hypothetical protein